MEEKKKLTDEVLSEVSGGDKKPDGLTCPRCKAFIATSIQQIITSDALVCPHCGLRLTIDKKS